MTHTQCRICTLPVTGGVQKRAGHYHPDCLRMQKRGLLYTGSWTPPPDATGQRCQGCGDHIDGPHAHRQGKPYHRECLT